MSSAIQFDCRLYYSTWEIQNLIEMTHSGMLILKAFRRLVDVCGHRWLGLGNDPVGSSTTNICYTRNVLTTSNVEYAVSSAPEAIMLDLLRSTHSLEPRSKVLQTPPDLSAVLFR